MTEIDFLYQLIAQAQHRIDELIYDGQLDVTWKGTSQYEQRCYKCGLWIDQGVRIATIRIIKNDALSLTKYVHEECLQ